MKKFSKIPTLLLLSASLLPISGCGETTTSSRWDLSETDVKNIVEGSAFLSTLGQNNYVFNIEYNDPVVSKAITVDDVKVIDRTKVEEVMAKDETNSTYLNQAMINQYAFAPSDVTCDEDNNNISVAFTSSVSDSFSLLINKDATASGNYVLLNQYAEQDENYLGATEEDYQTKYEKKYVSEPFTWENGGKFLSQLIVQIGTIAIGCAAENPCVAASGIFNVVLTLADALCSSPAQDIGALLKEINQKLTDLSTKLSKTYNDLSNSIISTQLQLTQAMIDEQQNIINTFNKDYVSKIESFKTIMGEQISLNIYNDITAGGTKTLDMWFYQNSDSQWVLSPIPSVNEETMSKVQVSISDFTNALASIKANGNKVDTGFAQALEKDIANATTYSTLLSGMTREELNQSCYAYYMETMMKKYFTDHSDALNTLQGLVQQECQAIYPSGGVGNTSVLENYFKRYQYMYNFGSELKGVLRTLFARLLNQLDTSAALVSLALGYSNIADTNFAEKIYKPTRSYIQNFYKTNVDSYSDNYSFLAGSTLQGEFYGFKYEINYTDRGNHPTFHAEEKLSQFGFDSSRNVLTSVNVENPQSKAWLDEITLKKIGIKYKMLEGARDKSKESQKDFVHYLNSNGAISSTALLVFDQATIDKDNKAYYNRIFTGFTSSRGTNGDDSSRQSVCTAQGNPGGDYFELGHNYTYGGPHHGGKYEGNLLETNYIDGSTGSERSETYLGMYYTYAESHWYWRQDEYWGFNGKDGKNHTQTCFFGIQRA